MPRNTHSHQKNTFPRSFLRSEPQAVVDGLGQVLFGSQVIHRRLNGFVAEEELDLFEGATRSPAEAR